MRRCPDCAAPASPSSCDTLFQRLLALDHSRLVPWGPLHGIAVACFLLQHPSRVPTSAPPVYWAMLHTFLEGGLDAVARLTDRTRRLNSHRFGGRPPEAADYPGAPPFPDTKSPAGYGTTIVDVAVDGSFPATGHETRVREWAADTTAAWRTGA